MSNHEDNTQVFSMFRKFSAVYSEDLSHNKDTSQDRPETLLNNVSPSPIPNISNQFTPSEMSTSLRYPGISQVASHLDFDQFSDQTVKIASSNPLKRKLDEKDADLLQARAKIIHLENTLESFEPESKQKLITLEKDYNLCKLQLSARKKEVLNIRNQMKLLQCNDDESKQLIADLKRQLESKRKEYDNKVRVLTDKYKQLERNYEYQAEKLNSSAERDRKFETMELELKLLTERSAESEQQIIDLVEKVKAKNKSISDVEIELNLKQQLMTELQTKLKDYEEQSCIQLSLKDEIAKLPQIKRRNKILENEVARLNKINCNVLLLGEQKYDLEKKLEREVGRNKTLQDVLCENENLKKKLSDWEVLSSGGDNTPQAIRRKIQELQKNEAVLIMKNGDVSSKLRLKLSEAKTLQDKIKSVTSDIEKNKTMQNNYLVMMKRLQKKNNLVTKERDSYKRILDSYETEITCNLANYTKDRINSLETIIKDYKATIEAYESEFGSVDAILNRTKPSPKDKRIEELTTELKSKERLIEELRAQVQKPNGNVSSEHVYHLLEKNTSALNNVNEVELTEKYVEAVKKDSKSYDQFDKTLEVQLIEKSATETCSTLETVNNRLMETLNKNHL